MRTARGFVQDRRGMASAGKERHSLRLMGKRFSRGAGRLLLLTNGAGITNERRVMKRPRVHKSFFAKYERSKQSKRAGKLYGRRWQKARLEYLSEEDNALCRDCSERGEVKAADQIHHIKAHRGDSELFWNQDNWMPLCRSCHSKRTAKGE